MITTQPTDAQRQQILSYDSNIQPESYTYTCQRKSTASISTSDAFSEVALDSDRSNTPEGDQPTSCGLILEEQAKCSLPVIPPLKKQASQIALQVEQISNCLDDGIASLLNKIKVFSMELSDRQIPAPKFMPANLPLTQRNVNCLNSKQEVNQAKAVPSELRKAYQTPKETEITSGLHSLEFGPKIGSGKFSDVYLCRHRPTGALLAVKKILKSTIDEYSMHDQVLTEIMAFRRTQEARQYDDYRSAAQGMVRFVTALTDDLHVFIVMVPARGISLHNKSQMSEQIIKSILRQLAETLSWLHQLRIAHRDIKPENILFEEETMQATLCDFGWASIDHSFMNITCGTLDYVCPQMVEGTNYTNKVDVWGLGVLAFELFHGFAPFKAPTSKETFKNIHKRSVIFSPNCSNEFSEFVSLLLKSEQERPTMKQVCLHSYLTQNRERQ